MSVSQSSSQTQTSSQTQSETASVSQTASNTASVTLTASQTASNTLTSSQTASLTSTRTQSPSNTQTRSLTPSQTVTGFPPEPVFDNTGSLFNNINEQSLRVISNSSWRGVLVHWPEDDPVCGAGDYTLLNLFLPLQHSGGTASDVHVISVRPL